MGVGEAMKPGPLDGVVRSLYGVSWGRARDLVRRGKIAVDGRTVTDPLAPVAKGAKVALDLAARDPRSMQLRLPREAIVFSDAHVVVVEKPAGVATIPFDPEGMRASVAKRKAPGEPATLDELVRAALGTRSLGVVHRLDKETSGLIVFTRSWAAKKALTQAFRFHRVHRRYLALVHGIAESATIESDLVENRGDGLRGSVAHPRGRKTQHAVTHVERLEAFDRAGASLVACRLETGRTHQIRIHLAERGHPLLGERVYVRDYAGPLIPAPRVMLHAAELGFEHPATGRPMTWTSAPPPDFEEMLAFLRSQP